MLVCFEKSDKLRCFKPEFRDICINAHILRIITRPQKQGLVYKFYEKKLTKGADIAGVTVFPDTEKHLLLHLNEILKSINAQKQIIFLENESDIKYIIPVISEYKETYVFVSDDSFDRVSEKIINETGASCVYARSSVINPKNSVVVFLKDSIPFPTPAATAVLDFTGKYNFYNLLNPEKINFKMSGQLKNTGITDLGILSLIIDRFGLPEDSLVF